VLDKFASGPDEEVEDKVDLAELVRRMEAKEAVALYVEQKKELVAPTSPNAIAQKASSPIEIVEVKMPSSIAKLPTDKGDIDQILQLLKRMDARMAAIELQQSGGGSFAAERPTRLPPPAASTTPMNSNDATLES